MIERLYVNNYRCFENFVLELAGRPSVLVIGKNGSGKSTLRQALHVFQNIGRGANRVRQLVAESDCAQQRKHLPIRFEIDVSLAGKRFRYAISFEFPDSFHEARVAEESLAVDGNAIYARQRAQVQLARGSTFWLDWHHAALPILEERPGENSLRQLRAYFASMVLVAPIPALMTGFSEEESVELRPDAANLADCLNALLSRQPASYNDLYGYLKNVLPDLSSFVNVPRGEKGKQLVIKFDRPGSEPGLSIDFKHLSDGEKSFFLAAFIIASNKTNGPVTCLWDEPDHHLALSELGQFITQLRKMTNRQGQWIATSHHPETIRKFSDDSTFVLARPSHLEPTVVRALDDLAYGGDLIEALVRDEVVG